MTLLEDTRDSAMEVLLGDVQIILNNENPSRDSLAAIEKKLIDLAAQSGLWSASDFPPAEGDVLHARYRVAGAGDLTLYLNVMKPGNKTPPHNHTTWACIAGVAGEEQNYLYERLDDGAEPGKAELRQTNHVCVAPGTGVALMPDDIHHVEVIGEKAIRHLHLYGRPLEALDERLSFDMASGTCKVMDIGVKSRGVPIPR